MSIAGASGDEVETVIARPQASGATETLQIDAQEDRQIVGYDLQFEAPGTGVATRADLRAWLGTDPVPQADGVEDIGGQFYATAAMTTTSDETNGVGYAVIQGTEQVALDADVAWDWNEDVTLTLELTEASGEGTVIARMVVYYVER